MLASKNKLDSLFHFSMLCYYLYADATMLNGLYNAHELRGRPPDDPSTNRIVNGSMTYITIWNMMIQQIYFLLCTIDHIKDMLRKKGSENQSSFYDTKRTLMLQAVLFPTTCIVCFVYWWYYWKAPRLIFGDILAEIFPWWVDHSMHTFILPIALYELYLSSLAEKESKDNNHFQGWLVYNCFITFYSAVVITARSIRGVWPYPFLDTINDGNPVQFFMGLYSFGWLWYFVGIYLRNNVWGYQSKIKNKLR